MLGRLGQDTRPTKAKGSVALRRAYVVFAVLPSDFSKSQPLLGGHLRRIDCHVRCPVPSGQTVVT